LKKIFNLFIGTTLIITLLTSCSNPFVQTPTTITNSQEIPAANQASEEDIVNSSIIIDINVEVLETVIYNLPEYEGYIYAATRIENTGTVAVEVSKFDCSLDIEDDNGNFIIHIDNVEVGPSVIMPGEIGYIVGSEYDDKIDPDKCNKVIANLSYDSSATFSDTLAIEDVSFNKFSSYFYATPGRVINENSYDIKGVTPIIAFFDKNGAFLGVYIDRKLDIKGSSKMGFPGEPSDPIPLSVFAIDDVGSIVAIGSYVPEQG